jgi:hypothetical protein
MNPIMTYPIHPACAVWPAMSEGGSELKSLADDIGRNGLNNAAVITPDGQLLDGKNRQRACELAGVELRVTVYQGNDPEGFTISQNQHRRHYSPAQLALIGEELASLKRGTNQFAKKVDRLARRSSSESQREIAGKLGITTTLIGDAKRLKRRAIPEVVDLVKQNKVGLKNAACYAYHTNRADQIADPKIVKREGHKLRTPRLYQRERKKEEATVLVPLHDIKQLRSLFKEVREQSTRHLARISTARLRMIASEAERIFKSWTDGDANAGRITDASTSFEDPAIGNGGSK